MLSCSQLADLRLSPCKKFRRFESLFFIKAERTDFSILVRAEPSVNHSGWKRSFSNEISFVMWDLLGLYCLGFVNIFLAFTYLSGVIGLTLMSSVVLLGFPPKSDNFSGEVSILWSNERCS